MSDQGMPRSGTNEVRDLFRLAWPLALGHLGNHLLGLVDTAVVGRAGEVPLAAVGLGNSIYFVFSIMGVGLMLGLDPIVSQAVGAGEPQTARRSMWQGVWLAVATTVPLTLMLLAADWVLVRSGIDPDTAAHTSRYLIARTPGILPFLVFVGVRSYLQANDVTRPFVVAVVVANAVNLPLSWVLVFGDGGLNSLGLPAMGVPALGAEGAGWTSTACNVLQMWVMVAAVSRIDSGGKVHRRPDARMLRLAVRLGIPIGLTLLAEVGIFSLTAMLAAWLGPRPLAAHNVAIAIAGATFQIALAVGIAASVRVGQAIGRDDTPSARRSGLAAFKLTAGVMGATACVFVLFPEPLCRIMTDQAEVIATAVPLFLAAAAFQLVDGAQAVMNGALRGAGDTRYAFKANVIGHYTVGLPLAVWLAFELEWGATGLWWGLCAGLAVVGVMLTRRFLCISKGTIARVSVR